MSIACRITVEMCLDLEDRKIGHELESGSQKLTGGIEGCGIAELIGVTGSQQDDGMQVVLLSPSS